MKVANEAFCQEDRNFTALFLEIAHLDQGGLLKAELLEFMIKRLVWVQNSCCLLNWNKVQPDVQAIVILHPQRSFPFLSLLPDSES